MINVSFSSSSTSTHARSHSIGVDQTVVRRTSLRDAKKKKKTPDRNSSSGQSRETGFCSCGSVVFTAVQCVSLTLLQYHNTSQYIISLSLHRDQYRMTRFLPTHTPLIRPMCGLDTRHSKANLKTTKHPNGSFFLV